MNFKFTSLRLDFISNDISYGVWDIAKENTFVSFVLKPLYLNTQSADPNSTAKSTKILEVVLLSYQQMNRRGPLSITWKSIVNTQDMKKSKGPVGDEKASTNQITFDTNRDSTVSMFNRTILG